MGITDSQTANTSLLVRVHRQDPEAWRVLTQIYGPVVYAWARRAGLQAADAADVVQDTFLAAAKDIHTRRGVRFRNWLWGIFHCRVCDHYRRLDAEVQGTGGTSANLRIQELPDSPPEDHSADGQREIVESRYRACSLLRDQFKPHHWTAFWRTAIEGDRPADVAQDLCVTVWVVYKASARVLQRLRRELEGMELLPEQPADVNG